ncbi:sorting nexin 2A-like [Cynara cardunculus var. scolymus]|uniref:Phox homologous domain-containing protein n=1 Tax=Cynara cardunculus var. scolymus TaxID=59895 RepID=A0A103YIY6_CYNCS|nr:sorting nexin 2A-like [Cynara cardunculus var. scolymus]KVI09979.1 Phox homologous domain-containing protein [Cynara cardunculus var. scolymus]
MMGYENQGFEDAQIYASREEMESLVLDDDDNNNNGNENNPSSRSNGGANGDSIQHQHPLSSALPFAEIPTTDDDDPLLSSSSPQKSPNSFNSFLEPPSYAEAVFRSFDGDHGKQINGHGAVSTSSPSSSSDYLKISVTDPQKEQDLNNSLVPGGNAYMTYLVTTWTNLPEFNGTEFSVRRRFKDVVTLSDRLSDSYRGFFIPLRPDKSVVESQVMQKQEFVEQRRMALEKYLRKLAAHPVIRRSEELRLFLQVHGKLPLMKTTDVASRMLDGAAKLPKQLFGESVVSAAVDPNDVSQPAKGGRDLLRIFKELRQSVTNDWGGTKPPVVEEDKEFLEKRKKLQDFEQELSNVSQQAESLVKAQQDIGETLGQLGLAFVKLTKFESEEAMFNSQKVRAADMKNVATSAVKASRLYRELNAQTVRHLDKLHEYLGVMLAVNNAYSDRSNALLTVQTLLSELATLNARIEKLEAAASKIFGGDRSRVRKIEELKETMRVTDEAKSCAVREYERIKENNKNELERLDKERHDDFFGMLKGFVANQAGYAEKMASVWETVANETSGYAKNC